MSALTVFAPALLFPALVIVAAMRDVTTFTIPNWLSLAGVIAFFPVALLVHVAPLALGAAAAVGVLGLLAGVVMFSLGWVGGGDAKLFAACCLWLGWPAVLSFMIWTALAGGCLALTLLWSRKLAGGYPALGPAWFGRLMQPGGDVPYGLAIAAGALVAFPSSVLMHPAL